MSDEAQETQRRAVNVNTATVEQLSRAVAGIGPVLAQRIVAWRGAHGPFAQVADLTQVAGIGPGLLARIGEQLTVEEAPMPSAWNEEIPGSLAPEEEPADLAPQETPMEEALAGPDEEEVADLIAPSEGKAPPLDALDLEPSFDEAALAAPLGAEWAEELTAPSVATAASEQEAAPQGAPQPTVETAPAFTPASAAAPTPAPHPRRPFWGGLGLVLLGGLVGVVLTLLAAVIWSGTVDFAPRRQFEALSRNVNTMYANQELAWQRLDALTLRADELERKVKRLEALEDRLEAVESGLRATETRLASVHDAVTSLTDGLAALQEEMQGKWSQFDGRLAGVESQMGIMAATVAQLQQDLDMAQARIKAYDGFLQGLRSLLHELDAVPTAIEAPSPIAPTPAAPAFAPTPTPAASRG